ncbi:hypothetical protein PoB_006785900 [Plakobranchus ocellatus]|uniref:Uncharacterized protein n=1 Tax=Plakobranchus ocellatus TaxID=259542 RepID=A0AAV4DB27_9GAST|nr:hypothetical protein PoB_006785900 [Plakobranchus ocellatus]
MGSDRKEAEVLNTLYTVLRMKWQPVRKLEGKGLITHVIHIKHNGKVIGSDRKEAEVLNHTFARVSTTPRNTREAIKMKRERKAECCKPIASNRKFEAIFSGNELEAALRKSKKGKTPGKDGVTQEKANRNRSGRERRFAGIIESHIEQWSTVKGLVHGSTSTKPEERQMS